MWRLLGTRYRVILHGAHLVRNGFLAGTSHASEFLETIHMLYVPLEAIEVMIPWSKLGLGFHYATIACCSLCLLLLQLAPYMLYLSVINNPYSAPTLNTLLPILFLRAALFVELPCQCRSITYHRFGFFSSLTPSSPYKFEGGSWISKCTTAPHQCLGIGMHECGVWHQECLGLYITPVHCLSAVGGRTKKQKQN